MSAAAETAWAIGRLDAELDLDAWSAYLTASLAPVGTWRPDEFDPERRLFTGNPDNPMTTSCRCRTLACATVVNSRSLCHRCREALASSGLDEDEFAHTYQPILVVQRLTGEPCVVVRDGVRCERRSISHRSGLCQAHTSRWINSRDRLGVTLEEWCNGVARPLPPRPECTVACCHNDARRAEVVCRGHFLAWRAEQRQGGRVEPAGVWAARQRPLLAARQFSLADLPPLPRTELLYALQQRDRQGQRLSPQAVRGLVSAWGDLDALVTTPTHELIARIGRSAGYRTYARWVGRYQLRSVAVPFGNCIEPSNMKAGGKACPIRFQCAGCGFYRPDPSYLPAIEAHINSLRADRETGIAIDADDFVVRNLSDQADAYRQVAATMRDKLATLTDTERSEVETASATLRKLRAAASVPVAFTKKAAR